MSRSAKVGYFFMAIIIMACFAYASVLMAQGRPGLAIVLFVVAIFATGAGFAFKGRFMKK